MEELFPDYFPQFVRVHHATSVPTSKALVEVSMPSGNRIGLLLVVGIQHTSVCRRGFLRLPLFPLVFCLSLLVEFALSFLKGIRVLCH
jgi:hypothetical protein